jgi:hypothetical protein
MNIWLFYTFTRYVGAWNQCFMSTNTSSKFELLLVLEQSRTWSNARDLRQHKCRPMLRLIRWINAAIPYNPYLPHGAFVEFSPYLEQLKGGTFRPCLPLTLFLKSIGENMVTMIIWFLNLRNSCTLFDVCFLTSAQHIFIFHPTLMGKGKGYNSSHAYCQVKGWFKKSMKLSQTILEMVLKMIW